MECDLQSLSSYARARHWSQTWAVVPFASPEQGRPDTVTTHRDSCGRHPWRTHNRARWQSRDRILLPGVVPAPSLRPGAWRRADRRGSGLRLQRKVANVAGDSTEQGALRVWTSSSGPCESNRVILSVWAQLWWGVCQVHAGRMTPHRGHRRRRLYDLR